jgi:acyl carrier protein
MGEDISASLGRYIATEILKDPGRQLAVDEPLISSGLVDSFSLVDLALFVESTFGVRIDDTELTAQVFDSVGELARLIRDRLPAAS